MNLQIIIIPLFNLLFAIIGTQLCVKIDKYTFKFIFPSFSGYYRGIMWVLSIIGIML